MGQNKPPDVCPSCYGVGFLPTSVLTFWQWLFGMREKCLTCKGSGRVLRRVEANVATSPPPPPRRSGSGYAPPACDPNRNATSSDNSLLYGMIEYELGKSDHVEPPSVHHEPPATLYEPPVSSDSSPTYESPIYESPSADYDSSDSSGGDFCSGGDF